MSRRKSTASADERREDWLRRGLPARRRPWALEEQLLGSLGDESRRTVLGVLASDLVDERAELSRLDRALHEQAVRVARLEGRLDVLQGGHRRESPLGNDRRAERPLARVGSNRSSLERDHLLCRCEGFWVDSPTGRIGLVEGLRFLSRIDQPDLLEVRAGLLGRQLLLIPTDQVEDVVFAEGRLVLRETPRLRGDHLHDLLVRLRKRRLAATS